MPSFLLSAAFSLLSFSSLLGAVNSFQSQESEATQFLQDFSQRGKADKRNLISFDYVGCRHSRKLIQSPKVTPPNLVYNASINCNLGLTGTPLKITLELYQSNVNSQNRMTPIPQTRKEYICASRNTECVTPFYVYTVPRTSFVFLKYTGETLSARGTKKPLTEFVSRPYILNDRGEIYPYYTDLSTKQLFIGSVVPFPAGPYDRCDDPNEKPPCKRDSNYTSKMKIFYSDRRLPFNGSVQGHHIKPLEFGGNNSTNNGVLLSPDDHLRYTRWWTGFSARRW
jgi:hypothetical protein